MAGRKGSSKKSTVVITGPVGTGEPSTPTEGVIGRRMNALAVSQTHTSRKSVHEGILLKRCRFSWRERIVEVIRDTAEYSGGKASYWLLIFDPQKRTLKDRIPMEDIVTIRASCDCFFQIFLSNGKILQFRADSMESQAYWMALIKVGLGRGSIFHVRVHTAQKGLEHALLYSIGVNLPAHRVGQLDRILVLASPINDININAWDLNRVKHFMRLDVGVQMELCSSCTTSRGHGSSITFIMEKLFHDECIEFLCHEARISSEPARENSLMVYPVKHICAQKTAHSDSHPPSYLESQRQKMEHEGSGAYSDIPPQLPPRNNLNRAPLQGTGQSATANDGAVPSRNITRKNFETAIPAVAHPYTNFQPHLFEQYGSSFESPYQISSRIIITNSGAVQYERNILGNKPQNGAGFHFKRDMPLPPRKNQAATGNGGFKSFQPNSQPFAGRTQSWRPSPQVVTHKLEKRASELSDSGDCYVFIPQVITPPNRAPPPAYSTESSHTHREQTQAAPPRDDLGLPRPPMGHSSTFPRPPMGNSSTFPRTPMGDSSLHGPPVEFTQSHFAGFTDDHSGVDMTSLQSSDSTNDYDDIVIVSHEVSHPCGNGTIPQVLATQEIHFNSPILVPLPTLDNSNQPHTVTCTATLQKPAIKPRRNKPSSESDAYPAYDASSTEGVHNSLTLPHGCSPSLSAQTLNTPSHHTLDQQSPQHTTPSRDTLQRSTSADLLVSDPKGQTERCSVHPLLTPPIPRPRGRLVRFAEHTQRSEDDSVLGQQSSVGTPLKERSLSTPFLHQDMPVSDV